MTIKPLLNYVELPAPATQTEVMPIIQWCKDNVGSRGIWWDIDGTSVRPATLIYAFGEEEHAVLFALKWVK